MASRKRTFEMCLRELMRCVGRGVDESFLKQDGWYMRSSWTPAEEADFKYWMVRLLRKRERWLKRTAERETGMFLLNYSWRYVPDGCMRVWSARRKR
jgi:hypothetical protein